MLQKKHQDIRITAIDILKMEDIHNVNFVQMKIEDFEENYLKNHNFDKIDLVMSDIAPNISGIDSADMPAMLNLAEIAADVAKEGLKAERKLSYKVVSRKRY